jgi:hypothetical protein
VNVYTTLQHNYSARKPKGRGGTWRAVAAGSILDNTRNTAVAKLADLLQRHIHDEPVGRSVAENVDQLTDYDAIARH